LLLLLLLLLLLCNASFRCKLCEKVALCLSDAVKIAGLAHLREPALSRVSVHFTALERNVDAVLTSR
tara:strand:- start:13 stop:213 length:201 start_codon:yes stop_codon:yes gene_type:complete